MAGVTSPVNVENQGQIHLPKYESIAGKGASNPMDPAVNLENGTPPAEKTTEPVQILTNSLCTFPHGVKVEEGSSLEETMKLPLHAVRKGVEVMAEAVSMLSRIDIRPAANM